MPREAAGKKWCATPAAFQGFADAAVASQKLSTAHCSGPVHGVQMHWGCACLPALAPALPGEAEAAVGHLHSLPACQLAADPSQAKILNPAGCRHDSSLLDWPEGDFRIFVGDLGNETNDDVLTRAFNKYATFNKARVVRDKRSNKTKGALPPKLPHSGPGRTCCQATR